MLFVGYELLDSSDKTEQTKLVIEAVAQRCSVKKVFLEISPNSQENTCGSLFFNKVAGLQLY